MEDSYLSSAAVQTEDGPPTLSKFCTAISEAVMYCRCKPIEWCDPDCLVGPVAGRFVGKENVQDLCNLLGNARGFNDAHYLMAVEQDDLYYVVGKNVKIFYCIMIIKKYI